MPPRPAEKPDGNRSAAADILHGAEMASADRFALAELVVADRAS
jgi:hypothetical protein